MYSVARAERYNSFLCRCLFLQPKMGLLQVVTLVLGFCLVFTKAESETATNTVKDDETFPIKDKLDSATVTEHWFSDVKEKLDPNETAEDDPKKLAVKEESKEARRTIRPWGRPAPIRLPIVVPNLRVAGNFFIVSYRFCFRRRTKGKQNPS